MVLVPLLLPLCSLEPGSLRLMSRANEPASALSRLFKADAVQTPDASWSRVTSTWDTAHASVHTASKSALFRAEEQGDAVGSDADFEKAGGAFGGFRSLEETSGDAGSGSGSGEAGSGEAGSGAAAPVFPPPPPPPSPLAPGSANMVVSKTIITVIMTIAGDVFDFTDAAQSTFKAGLRANVCENKACPGVEIALTIAAGSVEVTSAISYREDDASVGAAVQTRAQGLASATTADLSTQLGVTVESRPTVTVAKNVEVTVTVAAPLPSPPPPDSAPPLPPWLPLTPGSVMTAVTGTGVLILCTVAGDVSDFDQDAQDAILPALKAKFSCYPPDCYATLQVCAPGECGQGASVLLGLLLLSTMSNASNLIAQVEAAASEPLDSLSATLGVTVETRPAVHVREGWTMDVTLAAPSPPPSSIPPRDSPYLNAVRFSPSLDSVVFSFSQPTNQPAGCPLDGATLTLFAGSGTGADLTDAGLTCEWSDASTLVAYLTSASTLKPGSNIGLAPATIWPLGWSGSCAASPGMCSSTAEPVVLPTDAPCDDASTTRIVKACLTPVARISGPTSLSLCPGSALSLTGAYATADDTSGARRATQYRWGAAEGTANLDAISAHLATQSAESVQLSAELLDPNPPHSGGEYFAFTLRVVDVAGQQSAAYTHTVTRLKTPAPVVTIAAPTATLTLGAGELLLLQAKAQLVSCNGTEKGQC